MEHTFAVIMAGGGGTRLWPVSRRNHPKHALSLIDERSLFQSTVDRLEGLIPYERILVVTTADQEQLLKNQALKIPERNFLVEPFPRGTGPVVGLAAVVLEKQDPEATMIVLPADHFIRNCGSFQDIMRVAIEVARKNYLVTLGITPTSPATGYGYIQQAAKLNDQFGRPVFKVLRFTEKPDEIKANQMLAQGGHTWNSGMFVWSARRILSEISRQLPGLEKALETIKTAWGSPQQATTLKEVWEKIKSESIDYSIMENAHDVVVLPAEDLGWNDVGAWDAMFEVLPPDQDGNVIVNADCMPFDTRDSVVYSSKKKLVATIGIHDLVIIDTEDALLVCHRDQVQNVRQVIEKIKQSKKDQYL